MPSISWPWAIVLTRFADKPVEPKPPDYYRDLYTRSGTGGMCDFWKTVSCGSLDLTGSKVFGWFAMNHTSSEVAGLTFPGDRSTLVQWGRDAAAANGVNLSPFRSLLIVQNFGVDHGAAGGGILIVHQNPALCEYGFIAHEMGHGFGLPHSNSANPDTVYGDGWDLMSFATTTFQFPIQFQGTNGDATVGLNAPNLEALGAVPSGRTWVAPGVDFSSHITLDALNQTPLGTTGSLLMKFPATGTHPRPDGSSYTVEARRKSGWDRGIPRNTVLVHQVRANGLSYLQPTMWGEFGVGDTFVTPEPKLFVRVTGIDPATGTVTLRAWDIPDQSLRRDESGPRVYLIDRGRKRWVTSPQVLFGLGKTWADVRTVPAGGLSGVPDGSDVYLGRASWLDMGVPAAGVRIRGLMGTVSVRDTPTSPRRPHAFFECDDFNVWCRWSDGTAWHWTNMGKPPGANLKALVGAVTVMDTPTSPERTHVFITGHDGNVWCLWSDATSWHWTNLRRPTTANVRGLMGAVTVMDSPTSGQRPHVFVEGNDFNLWCLWWSGTSWQWTNMGKPFGVNLHTSAGVVTAKDTTTAPQRAHAFVTGTDGNLWCRWSGGASWAWTNMGKPAGANIRALMGAVAGMDTPTSAQRPHVFVEGDDFNLWCLWSSGTAWTWTNMGKPAAANIHSMAGGVTVMDTPTAAQRPYMFMLGNDRNLWCRWSDGMDWSWANVGRPNSADIRGLVGAVTAMDSAAAPQRPHVFTEGNDGHLWCLWYA